MTRDDFVGRWKAHIAGLSLFGYVSEKRDTPMERAEKVLLMPEAAEKLLSRLWDDAQPHAKLAGDPAKTLPMKGAK